MDDKTRSSQLRPEQQAQRQDLATFSRGSARHFRPRRAFSTNRIASSIPAKSFVGRSGRINGRKRLKSAREV
ncbi:hypothetical protein H3S83_01460 [Bartonella sp. W8122]|uniref:hypothetical protein n=1 Tax=Bartonella sp. W8122 TaxID=2750930 RepID=UPI0018DCD841|nr:hypothetical protein [Bartonella sp. W8122]MBI0000493.1 hypothetical protein [Bartonella sp. W8122]